jgi:ribosome-associated protein
MITISETLSLDENEIEESFIRASGPGGQNVNKVSSAVQIRFDARRSPSLPTPVALRLMQLAGRRLTQDGVIVITAQRFRDQTQNRADAQNRLVEMIREAMVPPKPRRATKPTNASREKRLNGKAKRSTVKTMRGSIKID